MRLKAEARHYRELTAEFGNDRDAMFIANVIMTSQSKRGTKMKNLLRLMRDGHRVHTAQFDIDRIIVDGCYRYYSYLDNPEPYGVNAR